MDPENELNAPVLFARYGAGLEDFWGRRRHAPEFSRSFHLFGQPIRLTANAPSLLEAVEAVRPLYSRAAPVAAPALQVDLVVADTFAGTGPIPSNLFDEIHYAGHGPWISLHLGPWGMAWADLPAGRAHGVLAPVLAQQPAAVARYLLNTLLLNLLDGRGYSMIHATSLVREGQLLLLMGPHNSGKSTTALHLVLAGCRFLADSQLYVSPRPDALELVGFPIGLTKLRPDMLAAFPHLRRLARLEEVRHENKYRIDLRQVDPAMVAESALVNPSTIHLCLLQRHERPETRLAPATREEMRAAVIQNGPFWHAPSIWYGHLQRLERLLARAHTHHLLLGTDPGGLLAAFKQLFP